MRNSLLASLFTGALCAQSFTVPSALANAAGNYFDMQTLYVSASSHLPQRVQLLWDTADIQLATATLKGLRLRRTSTTSSQNPSGSLTLSVRVGVGPNASSAASTTFASNLS